MNIELSQWSDVNLANCEKHVFSLQRDIFAASAAKEQKRVHQLQKRLLACFEAKCLAVSKVTEINAGRRTAGIDGKHSLSDSEKWSLVQSLSIGQPIEPVKRVQIPKPGKSEKRPLGIPTINNRALQALLVLALEPEWEARFTPGMFGFRKARSSHDAIATIRSSILFDPKWVLDADIEKFFDRVDHEALLTKLQTFPEMEQVIGRILKAMVLEDGERSTPERGTPQGGPLSPLLANIVLCGLETDLVREFNKMKLTRPEWEDLRNPVMAIYADDFVVLHKNREAVEFCRDFISAWLQKMGLKLHPEKTSIIRTLEEGAGKAGFEFLGFHIQQFRVGKYAVKKRLKRIQTIIRPAPESVLRIYHKIAGAIKEDLAPKQRGTRHAHGPVEAGLIRRLNPMIRGWSAYYCHVKATKAFNRLDHLIWKALARRLFRRHKKRTRTWCADKFLRLKGKWVTHCRDGDGEEVTLVKAAGTHLQRYMPVKKAKSYYDGDWVYWAARLGKYPSVPASTGRLLKLQHGRCERCGNAFTSLDHPVVRRRSTNTASEQGRDPLVLLHSHCDTAEAQRHGCASSL